MIKFLHLWKTEIKLSLLKLPFIVVCLSAIFASILVSFPASLLRQIQAKDVRIALVSGVDETFTKFVAGMTSDYDLIKRVYIKDTAEEGEAMLNAGEADILIIIPGSAEDALFRGEPAEVSVAAKDAFLGTVSYNLIRSTLDTVNAIEAVSSAVYNRYHTYDTSDTEVIENLSGFLTSLLSEAITRYSYISITYTSEPYATQIVSLLQFIAASVSAVCAAAVSSRQISDGYLVRLKLHGFHIRCLYAIKLINAVIITLLLSAAAYIALNAIGLRCSFPKYLLSAGILSIILTSVCAAFSSLSGGKTSTVSKTVLAGLSILLLCLFSGGGFYPIHLMKFSIQKVNPVWMAHVLADWSFSGSFPSFTAMSFFTLPFVFCSGLSLLRWKKSI